MQKQGPTGRDAQQLFRELRGFEVAKWWSGHETGGLEKKPQPRNPRLTSTPVKGQGLKKKKSIGFIEWTLRHRKSKKNVRTTGPPPAKKRRAAKKNKVQEGFNPTALNGTPDGSGPYMGKSRAYLDRGRHGWKKLVTGGKTFPRGPGRQSLLSQRPLVTCDPKKLQDRPRPLLGSAGLKSQTRRHVNFTLRLTHETKATDQGGQGG